VLAQSKPALAESKGQGDAEEDDDAKPTTAKDKESDRKSRRDEAAARPGLSNNRVK
jgi:hypothetical protein